ncbi:ankyrin repeat-containing domain protein [Coprinopsis sp. MPI-PUGE-AT-0042]|nr:ankyrin repeat-containing domain protein [Coprinopsis sp. MPI-PUGE-AT-0042]
MSICRTGTETLHSCMQQGWGRLISQVLLLDPRLDIHKRNGAGQTALHCALVGGTSSGHTEAALHLIATFGIDINAADDRGHTPLMLAYRHPHRLVESLVQHPNIDFLARDQDGQRSLTHACRSGGTKPSVQWFRRFPETRDVLGALGLAWSAEDYLSHFQVLIAAGLDVNERDGKGFTALTHAVQSGLPNATQALLQVKGIDVNLEDREGKALVMLACDKVLNGTMTSSDFARLLKHSSFDINAKNSTEQPRWHML